MKTSDTPVELLVLAGAFGLRFGVVGHYGDFAETPTFADALNAARARLRVHEGSRAFVAIRIKAVVVDSVGVERELVRFEVYSDRVALVPAGQGGLSDEQKAKVLALPRKGLL